MNGIRMTDDELTRAYINYVDMVYRIAVVQTKSKTQAEDIQQEVFMALVRYSDRIQSEEHLKAWLIRVTQNACHKHYRSLWIRLTVFFDDGIGKNDTDSHSFSENEKYPGEDDRNHLYDEIVQEAVGKLPENYRIVIHLFYYEELSVREIAQILKTTEQNVKTKLSRAREKLRNQLKEVVT